MESSDWRLIERTALAACAEVRGGRFLGIHRPPEDAIRVRVDRGSPRMSEAEFSGMELAALAGNDAALEILVRERVAAALARIPDDEAIVPTTEAARIREARRGQV